MNARMCVDDNLWRRGRRDGKGCQTSPHARSKSAPAGLRVLTWDVMQYKSIKPWQLRLLRLSPGCGSSPLHGTLLQATISVIAGEPSAILDTGSGEHQVIYQALSYTWGGKLLDDDLCMVLQACIPALFTNYYYEASAIMLDGCSFPISSNVDAALRQLRHEDCSTLLWIDALCINQDDLKERSEQVSNMLDIFRGASRVNVWLGTCPDNYEAALDYLEGTAHLLHADIISNDIAHELPAFRRTSTNKEKTVKPFQRLQLVLADSAKSAVWESYCRELYRSLLEFYSQAWLQRVWVRQEVYAAKGIVVMCGSRRLSWTGFLDGYEAAERLRQYPSLQGHAFGNYSPKTASLIADLKACTSMDERHPYLDIVEVLVSSRQLEATDERDKVFAVLGMCGIRGVRPQALAGGQSTAALVADYTRSIAPVWHDATRYLLQRPQRSAATRIEFPWADVFNYAARADTCHSHDLPSWVMDWSSSCGLSDMRILKQWRMNQAWGERLHLFPLDGPWSDHKIWEAPLETSESTLCIPNCHILSVITSATDFTCDLQSFLGMAPMYSNKSKQAFSDADSAFCSFDPKKHDRRAVWIAGPAHMKHPWRDIQQLALVPSTALPGDLVVAYTPSVLPLVIGFQKFSTLAEALPRISIIKRARKGRHCVQELQRYAGHCMFRGPAVAFWDPRRIITESAPSKDHLLNIVLV